MTVEALKVLFRRSVVKRSETKQVFHIEHVPQSLGKEKVRNLIHELAPDLVTRDRQGEVRIILSYPYGISIDFNQDIKISAAPLEVWTE